jgi:hypothetical protein
MKRISMCLPYLITLLLLVSFTGFAQQEGSITGGLSGQVTDRTGASLPGVTVTLVGPQGRRVLTTDSLGRYNATGLTPGYYDITVEKAGFSKVESKHNEVVVNSSSNLNITLGIGSVSETVEVTAAAAGIDTQATAITNNLTDTFYNSVPMPRNVSSIFYAAPGVSQGQVSSVANAAGPGSNNPSIGGSSPLENLYVVDGVTITDQAFGSIGTFNRYHGSLGSGINLAFIKEVDVKTYAFEPQYGKATGGIVQIVTKSGSNQYHGAVAAYFGPGGLYASRKEFYQFGYLNATPYSTLSSPQYDLAAEFGGYVPGFRDKLFFFGAFDPSLTRNILLANPNAPAASIALGALPYSTTALNWAGKLTYKVASATTFEASSFGDPSKHNTQPNSLSSYFPLTTASSYQYGSRDSVARVTTAVTSTWLVDAAYTYNYNHFDEKPAVNQYLISDQSLVPTGGAITATGLGGFEPSKNYTYSIGFNTSKTVQLLGQHTFSIGYIYDHTNFEDNPSRSGPLYTIPNANANNQQLSALYPGKIPASSVNALTNAQFVLAATNAANLADHTCTQCPLYHGEYVYVSANRGSYGGLHVLAQAKYHSAYFNDTYQMNRYVNFNLGVRWEQQRMSSVNQNYNYGASWSPRIGVTIDPLADHKTKLFFNFARNYWAAPLDAAIRELGNELDDNSYVFAPVIAADGSITIIPDSAHNLNGLPRSTSASGTITKFGRPSYSFPAESILPGTKQEYGDEYIIGVEREVKNGLVLKARYVDRRFGRIIEDIGSQGPEGSLVDLNFEGGIANPGPGTDISVNEQEITYTPAQYAAAQAASQAAGGKYVAPVPGCTANNDAQTLFTNAIGKPVGGACITNYDTAGGPGSLPNGGDGVPDGLVKPVRRYNAVELEMIKRFSNHWLASIDYRWGNLYGNYEGAYRNDNGQSDPGISSLFDFTAGKLGLLGDQFANGFLNSDRRNVGNMFLSYNVGSDTPFFSKLKGLTVGSGLRGQSGVPLSLLGDHPIYLNQGEVPYGGRGTAGRTPSSLQLDMHTDYAVPLGSKLERYRLKLAMDMFNVTNSQFQTSRNQYTQLGLSGVGAPPSANQDFGRPTAFQTPFYARGSVRFEF